MTAAAGASVTRPTRGHAAIRSGTKRSRNSEAGTGRVSAGAEVRERCPRLVEPRAQLVEQERQVAQRDQDQARHAPSGRRPPAIGIPPEIREPQGRERRAAPRSPAGAACWTTAWAAPAASHQRGLRVVQARHAKAIASEAASGRRFGFQMNVEAAHRRGRGGGEQAGDSPATGPPIARPSHQVTPTAAIPPSAIHRTTAVGSVPPDGDRGRGEQVVVERAVMDVADRGLRAEQRDDPVRHEPLERRHVDALVGVPSAALGEAREPKQGGDDDDARRGRRDRAPAPTAVSCGHVRLPAPRGGPSHLGPAARDRLPRISSASRGNGASRIPAARSRARATLTAS